MIFSLQLFVCHLVLRIRLSSYSDSLFPSFLSGSSPNFFLCLCLLYLHRLLPECLAWFFRIKIPYVLLFHNIHLLPSWKHVHSIPFHCGLLWSASPRFGILKVSLISWFLVPSLFDFQFRTSRELQFGFCRTNNGYKRNACRPVSTRVDGERNGFFRGVGTHPSDYTVS